MSERLVTQAQQHTPCCITLLSGFRQTALCGIAVAPIISPALSPLRSVIMMHNIHLLLTNHSVATVLASVTLLLSIFSSGSITPWMELVLQYIDRVKAVVVGKRTRKKSRQNAEREMSQQVRYSWCAFQEVECCQWQRFSVHHTCREATVALVTIALQCLREGWAEWEGHTG